MKFRGKVYVAGPYTYPDPVRNVGKAIDAAQALADLGFAPFVPHLNFAWDMKHPRPPEFWYALTLQFLPMCDAILRLPGESLGSDCELDEARRIGVPIFYSIEDLDVRYTG